MQTLPLPGRAGCRAVNKSSNPWPLVVMGKLGCSRYNSPIKNFYKFVMGAKVKVTSESKLNDSPGMGEHT